MQKQRKISIEMLRILAMFMIILGHSFTHGHAANEIMGGRFLSYLRTLLIVFSIPGTNIFVLISGYFLYHSEPSIKRVTQVWCQMLFYSLGIYLVLVLLRIEPFSIVTLVKSIFPVAFNRYWFMRVYFYMVLCFPFLNVLINHLTKRGHQYLLLLGVALMVIPASIPGIAVFNEEAGNGILWFFMLYFTGAYFSKYPPNHTAKTYGLVALAMFMVAFLSRIGIEAVTSYLGLGGMGGARLSTFDAFPIYIESCCVLCSSIRLSDKEIQNQFIRKSILLLAGSTAGVYMIHEHPLMRPLIWKWLNVSGHSIWYAILVSCAAFVVCSIVDLVTWKRIVPYIGKRRYTKLAQIEET